jgi:hypothetical protein
MRGSKIPTYIGVSIVFSMVVYAWTVFGSTPQAKPRMASPLPTPTNTSAPWWYYATPVIATNTPEPTEVLAGETDQSTAESTEQCPALQTPTPPVITIVLPPLVILTPVAAMSETIPITVTDIVTSNISATVEPEVTAAPTAAVPQPTPTLPVITRIFGPVVAHGTVNTNVLRLRYGPSTERDTIVFMFNGSKLDVFGKSPDGQWLGVRVTGTNLYGWVSARFVRVEK